MSLLPAGVIGQQLVPVLLEAGHDNGGERTDEGVDAAPLAANGSAEAGQACAVVLAGDATELVSRETAKQVESVGIPPVRDLFRKLLDSQVAVYV